MATTAQRVGEVGDSATVRIADMASSLRREGLDVLDFSAGRAAEHTPAYISEAAVQAIQGGDTHQTMARGTPAFREACAGKLERENGLVVEPDAGIIATMGCKQGLLLALMAILDPGDEVLIEDPCFVSYQPTIRFCGGEPVAVPLGAAKGFRWQAADLEAARSNRTRAILFCSPHNPTGIVHTPDDLDVIADFAERHDLLVITDETYERLIWGGKAHTPIATRPGMAERTIGLMGVTKAFSMGGWRVGFAYAPSAVIEGMVVVQQHLMTCAGSFAQAGAARALGEAAPAPVVELWADWEERCRYVVTELNRLPRLTCSMPEGGFYAWIDIQATGCGSVELAERLLREHHVALVPGAAFGPHGEGYLRMTCVKSWVDLRGGVARLQDGLGADTSGVGSENGSGLRPDRRRGQI